MKNDPQSPSERALQLLNEWIKTQHVWLQEAYRQLVAEREISEAAITELVALCKSNNAIDITDGPVAIQSGSPGVDVRLRALTRVRGVNAIEQDARLEVRSDGLFVVYGDNGAGKSGYARILRHACRARAPSKPILGNIYDSAAVSSASAGLELEVDGVLRTALWSERRQLDEVLGNISVFDSECAVAHVTSENEIAFKPEALHLLEQLAHTATRVRAKLEAEKELKRAASSKDRIVSTFNPNTLVGRSLAGLSGSTDIDKVKAAGALGDQDAARLERLRVDLASEPAVRARQVRGHASHLEAIGRQLSQADTDFGPDCVQEARKLHSDAVAAAQASRIAAREAFEHEDLAGVGSAAWRELWESARRFSTIESYPGEEFPVVRPGSRCVLCLQELRGMAPRRLNRFETYVQADVQRRARDAKDRVETLRRRLRESRIPRTRRLLAPVLAELEGLEDGIRRRIVAHKLNRRAALRALSGHEGGIGRALTPDVQPSLTDLIRSLRTRAGSLEAASASSDRSALVAEFQELEDRRLLSHHFDAIKSEIWVLGELEALDRAIARTDTAPITRRSTALAKDLVTPGLRDAFAVELQRLKVVSARVELVGVGGRYGAQRYQVRLIADPETPPLQVLSEGEHRAVALGGFLSELSTASHRSTIVLDDPVSSLDHRWRRHVASRLVEEAITRQVIVFTHDAVFLMNLMEAAESAGQPIDVVHLARRGTTVGIPRTGAPWIAMKVKERISYLNRRLQEAEADLNAGHDERYRSVVHDLYGLLREAWERAVEEVLLNRAVIRFGREVQTNRLKPLTDISDADLTTIENAMTKASRYIRGHDDSAAIVDEAPRPDELRGDINELAEWVRGMRKRGRQ